MFVRPKYVMSEEEQIRFNEIVFYNLIIELLYKTSDAIKIQDFIEVVASLSDCNISVLQSVVNIIMTEDRRYIPSQKELVTMMYRANIPVREILKGARLSQRGYYKLLNESHVIITRKFSETQYIAMMKFLDTLQTLTDPLNRRYL